MKKLCNFLPYLVGEITLDDGAEQKKCFRIGGVHTSGQKLPEITLPVSEFSAMGWIVERWGAKCNLEPGQSVKEQIRYAIQSTGEKAEQVTIHGQLGWKKLDGGWRYLMPGVNDIQVSLPASLSGYGFAERARKFSASLELLDSGLAPEEILWPLWGFMYLAPLQEFLRQAGHECRTVLALIGRTGSKKSTLAALILSHFGRFTFDSLPLTFRDTANSILERLFLLKDVPTVIDDFHPGTHAEEAAMTRTAQLIMRAFGDRTGRGRMRSDLTLAESKPPQGLGIITAEYPPDLSESGAARYLSLEIKPSSVDLNKLTHWQEQARNQDLINSMRAYIEWLQQDCLRDENKFVNFLRTQFERHRSSFHSVISNSHDRIPDACAWLFLGFSFALLFYRAKGLLSVEQQEEKTERFRAVLTRIAQRQAQAVEQETLSEKFIRKLFSLLDSGTVSIPEKNYAYEATDLVGYQDEDYFYLITDAAHRAVKKLCGEQGEAFSCTTKSLLRQLDEDGYLEKSGKERTRTIRLPNQKMIRVMFLRRAEVLKAVGRDMC